MKNWIVIGSLFFTLSVLGQGNVNKWKNSSIMGSIKNALYSAEIEDGKLYLGMYVSEDGFTSQGIELINETKEKVFIEKVIYKDQDIFVVGSLKNDKGTNYYLAKVTEVKDQKVSGQLFYHVSKNEKLIDKIYAISEDNKSFGLALLKNSKSKKLVIAEIVSFNFDGEVLSENELEFYSEEFNGVNQGLFDIALFEKQILVVFSELVDSKRTGEYQTTLMKFKDEGNKKVVVSAKQRLFENCKIGVGKDDELLLVGFPVKEDKHSKSVLGYNVVRINKEDKVNWSNIGFDGFKPYKIEGFDGKIPAEIIVSNSCVIEKVSIDERGNAIIVFVDEHYAFGIEKTNYFGDVFVMCLGKRNELNWNSWVVFQKEMESSDMLVNRVKIKNNYRGKTTYFFDHNESMTILARRPMFELINNKKPEIPTMAFWVNVNLENGELFGPGLNKKSGLEGYDFFDQYLKIGSEK